MPQNQPKTQDREEGRKSRTLFWIFFPSVIILALGITIRNQVIFTAMALLVMLYQYVVIRNFVDMHYGE